MRFPVALTVTAALSLSGSLASAQGALADHLPAGALLTVETHQAGPALERLSGLIGGVLEDAGLGGKAAGGEPNAMLTGFTGLLQDAVGREGVLGVFTVGTPKSGFSPQVLAVTRAGESASGFLQAMLPEKPGARVGNYPFSRVDGLFVGQVKGLAYASTDKALLMSYLGRLSGKAGPRLNTSAAYSTATRPLNRPEVGVYANFSAAAKLVRAELGRHLLPRLFSPVVDGLDTLGQYASGLRTTDSGLNTVTAHVVNTQGKDRPLAALLTHTADFGVQNILPADVENVQAQACAPETGAYLGRWLTRLDLFEPFGFLTDSQLAAHLERSGRYLGSECAQVTLAGGLRASLDASDPMAALRHSVTYQRVTDQAAAEAHLPEYAASLNDAIRGLRSTLKSSVSAAMKGDLASEAMDELGTAGLIGMGATMQSLEQVDDLLVNLKLVYGFRDGYLVTAFSEDALRAALAPTAAPLAQSEAFRAADLKVQGVGGWTYQPDQPDLSGEDLLATLPAELAEDEDLGELVEPVMDSLAGLINRYGGMTSQRDVQGNVIIGQANVRFDW